MFFTAFVSPILNTIIPARTKMVIENEIIRTVSDELEKSGFKRKTHLSFRLYNDSISTGNLIQDSISISISTPLQH